MKKPERAETALQHPAGVETPADNHPLLFPIYQNVKWESETVAETLRVYRGERPGFFIRAPPIQLCASSSRYWPLCKDAKSASPPPLA